MSQLRHDKWTDLLKPTYDYPAELDDAGQGRRARRQAKREWRAADQQARAEFIAERRAEPVSQGARLGVAIFLAAVVLIGAIAYGVRAATDDEAPSAAGTAPVQQAPAGEPTASTTTTPESEPTAPAAEVDPTTFSVEEATERWARAWFSYAPTTGDSQADRMERAEELMTEDLAAFLWTDDAVAAGYEASGTDVEVSGVKVEEAPKKTAPPDTEMRATRKVTVSSSYTAGPSQGEKTTSVYLVTLLHDEAWRVADYTGQEH